MMEMLRNLNLSSFSLCVNSRMWMSVFLYVCLSVCLSVCMYVCMYVWLKSYTEYIKEPQRTHRSINYEIIPHLLTLHMN